MGLFCIHFHPREGGGEIRGVIIEKFRVEVAGEVCFFAGQGWPRLWVPLGVYSLPLTCVPRKGCER